MIFEDTLTLESLTEDFVAWNKSRKSIRFGQFICNKYLVAGKSAPEIFYAEDASVAYNLTADVLVNQEI